MKKKKDKYEIKGRILTGIGLIFLVFSLIKLKDSNNYLYFALIGFIIGLIGTLILGKSKSYKNPFEFKKK